MAPGDYKTQYRLGRALLTVGHMVDAQVALDEALRLQNGNADIRKHRDLAVQAVAMHRAATKQ